VRWGGEEFIIVARGLTPDGLEQLAERIQRNIESQAFDIGLDNPIYKTCLLGITSYSFISNNIDELPWDQTINLANVGLFIAKNNGRNSWGRLFENNIQQPEDIYEEAIKNLKQLIDNGSISYTTNLTKEDINF